MRRVVASGYTIIELLVVLAIMVIVTGITMSGFQNYARYQQYNQSVSTVRAVFQDARMQARASEGGQAHGVKILSGSLVTYPGSTYSAVNPSNVTTSLGNVILTPILTSGATEVTFSNLTGLPSATGTIQIVGVGHVATTTIEITAAGGIQ